jgi:hypothetical protein
MMSVRIGTSLVLAHHLWFGPAIHSIMSRVPIMSRLADVRVTSVPSTVRNSRGLIRWVCTNNPFYVLSAGLFLMGLWVSFGAQSEEVQTWALMSGLAGYTLLLAVTACLLVRFGNVWEDVRTMLLLVVLMFLATSVTFDEVLVFNPDRGFLCYISGLFFAIAVSEGLLHGMRLALPVRFRAPYYLILALFFLYPLALRPLLADPRSEALMWGLFGFSAVAGLVFLTLLPAIRRGPDYIRNNGSPWRWPLYPWVLFGLLGLAVPARAFLLCWSMQLLQGNDSHRLVFGPFFLVPFGLAVAVLLLEIGLVSGLRGVLGTALALPAGLTVLILVGHRDDPIYRDFLDIFATRLGGDPLSVTLLASAAFYVYAALRRVPLATEALTVTLAALAFVGPDTLNTGEWGLLHLEPIVAAVLLQLGLGIWRRVSWQCLLGVVGLATVAALALPEGAALTTFRGLIAFHLALIGALILGAAFDDGFVRFLRFMAVAQILVFCLASILMEFDRPTYPLPWEFEAYPLVMTVILAGYGLLAHYRLALATATLTLTCWLAAAGWRGYCWLRQAVTGLDHFALSLALFALAILISLGKSGLLSSWIAARWGKLPRFVDLHGTANTPPAHGIWREGPPASTAHFSSPIGDAVDGGREQATSSDS